MEDTSNGEILRKLAELASDVKALPDRMAAIYMRADVHTEKHNTLDARMSGIEGDIIKLSATDENLSRDQKNFAKQQEKDRKFRLACITIPVVIAVIGAIVAIASAHPS